MTRRTWTIAVALTLCACSSKDGSDGNEGTGGFQGTGATGSGGFGSGGMVATATGGTGTGGDGAGGMGTGGMGTGGMGTGGMGTGGMGTGGMGTGGGDPGPEMDSGTPMAKTVCKAPVVSMDPGTPCPAQDPVALKATMIASGLSAPIFLTAPRSDTARLFVALRSGVILIFDAANGGMLGTFLDIDARVINEFGSGERGLLGLAFHPDYPTDRRFFVAYTAPPDDFSSSKITVSSFEVSMSDPNDADENSEQVLLTFGHPQSNHNGGMLAFGPDGCLFFGSGDGGGSGDPEGDGQKTDNALGKILRINVDDPNTAAPGNLAGAAYPHIWDYGLRNPWRFSFDRSTGDLYIGDVGQGAWEEVDVEPAGAGNKNYGWPEAEGNHCFGGGCTLTNFVGAVYEYANSTPDNCIIGGFVYRGSRIPSLQGWYLHADNGSNRIRAFFWDGAAACRPMVISQRDGITVSGDITSFGEDGSGELYIVTMTSVYRIDAQ